MRHRTANRSSARKASVASVATVAALAVAFPGSALASGAQATKLTAHPPANAAAEAAFAVSGRLATAGGHGLRAERLGLYFEPSGANSYMRLASTRTTANGTYSFSVALAAGQGRLEVKFPGTHSLRSAIAIHPLTINPALPPVAPGSSPPANVASPAPVAATPAGAPTPTQTPPVPATGTTPPTPPTPPPPPILPAGDTPLRAHTAGVYTPGITFGPEECLGGIGRTAPSVGSPTGQWVWTIDQVWAIPTNGSAPWHLDASGDYYYNGTARPVFDWNDIKDGHIAGGWGDMDSWGVNSGWTVSVIQWVWVNGTWYDNVGGLCSF
jgi:hypothetical protein